MGVMGLECRCGHRPQVSKEHVSAGSFSLQAGSGHVSTEAYRAGRVWWEYGCKSLKMPEEGSVHVSAGAFRCKYAVEIRVLLLAEDRLGEWSCQFLLLLRTGRQWPMSLGAFRGQRLEVGL